MKFGFKWTAVLAATALALALAPAQAQSADPLKSGFENPPDSARPRVWWHLMNGNITQEGMKLDLEWMRRAGLAGFQAFDAALMTPQVVEKRLVYMTPEWKDAFKFATQTADRLGLEEAIAGSPGWSESGGPWVPAAEGMKKYVWSELAVEGGKPFHGVLPHPPTNTGAFQNLPLEDFGDAMIVGKPYQRPDFYADSAVIAYRAPATDVSIASLHPKITASSGTIDASILADGDLVKSTSLALAPEVGGKAWVQFEFDRPTAIRGLTLVAGKRGAFDVFLPAGAESGRSLEASDDGVAYRTVAVMPNEGSTEHTLSFAPITAKFFRVVFKTLPPPPADALADFGVAAPEQQTEMPISELVLHPGARVNRFEEKAAFTTLPDLYALATPEFTAADAIAKSDVVDLTAKMQPDGTLDWTPPAGNWVVLRFGYSLLGITNHPATAEATGLEVDKLDHRFVQRYMDNFLDSYKSAVGPELMGKRGLRYVVNDSWEAGAQNWTDKMIDDFMRLRGYDPRPWMPVLAGRIVESARASDAFLWDLRKTVADLTADEHYGQLQKTLEERGLGHYGESHESGRALIADGMEVKKFNNIPMSAMWTQKLDVNNPTYGYNADDRESASVAHIYGQNLAAAESMTSCDTSTAWAWSPQTLRPTADQEFLNGINRFVIHESAHQPLIDKAPGMTLGNCGQWFNRNETWAEHAKPWIDYLSRNSFLLQQGRFAADVLYFYGEDSNITAEFADKSPDVPTGSNFDYINADGLIHEFHVEAGRLVAKSGASYPLLVLDKYSRHMSLPVLKAIHALVEQGAVVAGQKPVGTPSLADNSAEFARLNDALFGDGSGTHSVGKGKVFAGDSAADALKALAIEPDFDAGPATMTNQGVPFVHRKIGEGDIYFVDNRTGAPLEFSPSFRVAGKSAELWHSDSGRIEPASYSIANGRTTVPLKLETWGSVFVVFRKPAPQPTRTLPAVTETTLATLDGPWTVAFQPRRGAPATATLDKLASWHLNADPGIQYFSGVGAYTRTVEVKPEWLKGGSVWIDLGDVKNIAVVTLNGKQLATVWHKPFRVELTGALKPGTNELKIEVINAWVNRLIGDEQPGVQNKITFADFKAYKASSPLLESGLLGPVTIVGRNEK